MRECMLHSSVNPYIVALNTEMFQHSRVPAGPNRLQHHISSGIDSESPITVKFVHAYNDKIYNKYAQFNLNDRWWADDEYVTMREPTRRDQAGVKDYKKFVQAHKRCRPLWKNAFGLRADTSHTSPDQYIAMGINKDKKLVACAFIEFISVSQVGTIEKPIRNETKVAYISGLASSEERRGHAKKLFQQSKNLQ